MPGLPEGGRPTVVSSRMRAIGFSRSPFPAARDAIRCGAMETTEVSVPYAHTDACNPSRWNTRESYQFMYGRPWQKVVDFYSDLVRGGAGCSSLYGLLPLQQKHVMHDVMEEAQDCEETKLLNASSKDRTGRWARVTFKIVLSYHGGSFDGWQKQPGLNTVQGLVEKSLGRFVDCKKARQLMDKSLPVEGCASVAGRTDKGVTALQQVCSFYTWRKDIKCSDILDSINEAAQGKLRALHVLEMSRKFHPNFSAKWRHYFYIFPLDPEEDPMGDSIRDYPIRASRLGEQKKGQAHYEEDDGCLSMVDVDEDDVMYYTGSKPKSFSVSKVNQLICQLEGKLLSYRMFARDTKTARSVGPPTDCFMFHARAAETTLPLPDEDRALRVMCVELVANRFLRKMVRVLVATAIREAAADADDDALLKLMDAACRRATAPPAPPDGLCLVDVGYGEFDKQNCLIH